VINRHKGTIISVLIGLAFFATLAIVINRQTPRVDPQPTGSNWVAPVLATTTPAKDIVPDDGWWEDMPTPPTMSTAPARLLPKTATPSPTP